jgi:hypothetical protein
VRAAVDGPPEVRAPRCGRTFTILADGGVKATYDCGAVVVHLDETAVDVRLLEERFSHEHHHRHHLRAG